MDQKKIELALNIIDLKIAQIAKQSNEKSFKEIKEQMIKLNKEKEMIYLEDENTINKVLNIYYKEVI